MRLHFLTQYIWRAQSRLRWLVCALILMVSSAAHAQYRTQYGGKPRPAPLPIELLERPDPNSVSKRVAPVQSPKRSAAQSAALEVSKQLERELMQEAATQHQNVILLRQQERARTQALQKEIDRLNAQSLPGLVPKTVTPQNTMNRMPASAPVEPSFEGSSATAN